MFPQQDNSVVHAFDNMQQMHQEFLPASAVLLFLKANAVHDIHPGISNHKSHDAPAFLPAESTYNLHTVVTDTHHNPLSHIKNSLQTAFSVLP